MGIFNLLPHLPGGGQHQYRLSFYDLQMNGEVVPFDAAGALWDFASHHAWDFLRGNHNPALLEWAHLLIHLRSICKWNLLVFMDGMENDAKSPEIQRRKASAAAAKARGDLRGQIKNTPEYIAKAVLVCKFLDIDVRVSAYEADPQVSYVALQQSLVPISGDSDLLAYGVASKLILVKGYGAEMYRVIDLNANVAPGDYPLFDLYKEHGRVVFQLYAACSGCDFTNLRSGIADIGYKKFITCACKVEVELTANTLADVLWEEEQCTMEKNGFGSAHDVARHLQHVVDVYSYGMIYDKHSNIIDMSGRLIHEATSVSSRHMAGEAHSRTREEFDGSLREEINNIDCSQLIMQTAMEASKIRGVNLPEGRKPEQCHVPDLRDFVAARGGKITMNKPELVTTVKLYQFIEKQVPKAYVDRNPDPNGSLYAKVDTSGTRRIDLILQDLAHKADSFEDSGTASLIKDTYKLFSEGAFDDKYDNIARVAPELKEGFIYKEFGYIGQSLEQKNIGDALKRTFYENECLYHGIAFVPDSDKVIILTKAHASMARDEKTRNETDDGEPPKKKEYLLIMELNYMKTDEMEHRHGLGVFTTMGRSYCAACTAGQGECRHRPERLWYQYHHWTESRLGIDRPPTLDVCGWAQGGKKLTGKPTAKIYEQQSVKYESTLNAQTKKTARAARRDCTEGNSCDYQLYYNQKKRGPHTLRCTKDRTSNFFYLLKTQSTK